MNINKSNLEATTANLISLRTHKETLESPTWDFKLLPSVKYAEYMAERSAVYEEHRGDRERIISYCADIYNDWEDKNIPMCVKIDGREVTLVDVNEAIAEMEEQLTYQELRAASYPSLADQADMQFHDAVDGTTTWKDAIQAVKDTYPKP